MCLLSKAEVLDTITSLSQGTGLIRQCPRADDRCQALVQSVPLTASCGYLLGGTGILYIDPVTRALRIPGQLHPGKNDYGTIICRIAARARLKRAHTAVDEIRNMRAISVLLSPSQ